MVRTVARGLCATHQSRALGKKTRLELLTWNRRFASLSLGFLIWKMGIMHPVWQSCWYWVKRCFVPAMRDVKVRGDQPMTVFALVVYNSSAAVPIASAVGGHGEAKGRL